MIQLTPMEEVNHKEQKEKDVEDKLPPNQKKSSSIISLDDYTLL